MLTLCAGYNNHGKVVPCGKVLKNGSHDEGISHGQCEECLTKWRECYGL